MHRFAFTGRNSPFSDVGDAISRSMRSGSGNTIFRLGAGTNDASRPVSPRMPGRRRDAQREGPQERESHRAKGRGQAMDGEHWDLPAAREEAVSTEVIGSQSPIWRGMFGPGTECLRGARR